MAIVKDIKVNKQAIYIEPNSFADYLSCQQHYILFLDIDGTLAEFTVNPKHSFIPPATILLLQQIQQQGVKIAFVTGRSLIEARQMLFPLSCHRCYSWYRNSF